MLVDAIVPPRGHDHEDDAAHEGAHRGAQAPTVDGTVHLAGRTRESKLVHLSGDPALLGRLVRARIEHAGPYALRGVPVQA